MKSDAKKMRWPRRIQLRNIRSLTEFQRNAKQAIRELKRSGQPQVLTVNGKAALIVQDAESYQELLDAIDRAEAIEGVRKGLEAMERGETYPIDEAFERIRRKHGIPRKNPSRR